MLCYAFDHAMAVWPKDGNYVPLLEIDRLPGAVDRSYVNTTDSAPEAKAAAKLLAAPEMAMSWVDYARVRGERYEGKLTEFSIKDLLSKPPNEIIDVCKDAATRAPHPYRCAVCIMFPDRR